MIAGLLLLIAGCTMPNVLIGVVGGCLLVGTPVRWVIMMDLFS